MQKTDELVNTLVKAVDDIQNKKAKGYDTQATVTRIEGGTAYVHIPGGVDETPAQMTITAKKGDTVRVRVANGTAWLVGNATAPPTDDATANAAVVVANTATTMAGDAIESANIAAEAAESAKTSAVEAKTQAINATNYANGALTQLGTVESVVDTLNWIAEHSTFVLTTDASVVSGKTYYIPSNNTLTITANTQTVNGVTFTIDEALGTVTMNGTATDDTYVILGSPAITASDDAYLSGVTGGSINTYALRYAQSGAGQFVYDGAIKLSYYASYNNVQAYVKSGATVNNVVLTPRVTIGGGDYEYQIVENPTGNPSTQGYYELNTSDAVKTYVQSHLSLTNDGLYVLKDGSGWKVLIKNNGVEILDDTGNSVAEYGASVRIGQNANGYSRTEIADSGMSIIHRADNSDSMLAKFGYGPTINGADQTVNGAYFSLGADRNARGILSISAGVSSHADGAGSIATGFESTASGHYSATFGYQTISSGPASCSTGDNSHATGAMSFAGGYWARVNGDDSIGFGDSIKANYAHQAAFGKHNDNKSTNLFEIGNGSSSSALSNAFEVDTSGNVNIPSGAKYKINGTALSASDVSALATTDKYTRSAVGGLDWTTTTEGDAKVIMKSALAFWNGSYDGATSNIQRLNGTVYIGGIQLNDFVKEQGLSSSWYYRKWNSGKVEAWRTYNAGSQTPSQWVTGWYYKDFTVAIPSDLFSSAPNTTIATNNGSDMQFMVFTARATSATSITVRVVKPNSGAATPVIALYVCNMV